MKYDHSMDFGSYFFPTEMGAVSKSLNGSDGLFEKKVLMNNEYTVVKRGRMMPRTFTEAISSFV